MRQEIPLLDQVHVEKPCHADWDGMTPIQGQQVKHCVGCKKNVYNLSAMTEQDANTLLAENSNLCVRYAQDDAGQILTQPQRSRFFQWKTFHSVLRFAASVAAIVAGIFGHSASADTTTQPKKAPKKPAKTQSQTTRKLIMGKRAMPTHTMGKPVARPAPTHTMGLVAPSRHTMGEPVIQHPKPEKPKKDGVI